MTPEQWKTVEAALAYPHGRARIKADGHVITMSVEMVRRLRYAVVVYIDEIIDWKKTVRPSPDSPERKFWRAKKIFLFPSKHRVEAAQKAKKRNLDAVLKEIYIRQAAACTEMLDPYWTSAKPLCRHLRKTCTEIELLPDFDDADTAEAAQ